MDYPGFVGSNYETQAVTADQEDTINWYFENMESQGATSKSALYPTPGVLGLGTATSSPGRAHFFQDGREFAVIGGSFVEIGETGTPGDTGDPVSITVRGTVGSGTAPSTISSNGDGGNQLFITSGGDGYVYDLLTDTLTAIAALAGKATMGDYLDGYFLALDAATSTLYISDLLDGTTWDPTQFAQRSAASDPWVSMRVSGQYIWLFGEQTSEVWYDAGSSPFPFAKYPSGLVPYGIAASFSRAVADGSIVWLGANVIGERFVLRASGFTPEVISDYPRQSIFAGYGTVDDAVADTFNFLGHVFYMLTFPSEDITWCWDANTGRWFKWLTWISESNTYTAFRPRWHAMAFGQHRMLDSQTGDIYNMSSTGQYTTDVDGRIIRRLRRAPALMAENQRLFFSSFELDLEPGLGNLAGDAAIPEVMLSMSNDGGKTWGPEMMRSAGATGAWSTRVIWRRLGTARRRVFQVVFSDPCLIRITNAYLTMSQVPAGKAEQASA